MDTRLRKRLQLIRNMTNEQLNDYRKNLVEKGFMEGMRSATNALVQAMEEEPKIYNPMIERVKARAVEIIHIGAVDMGDNQDEK